MQLRFRSSHLRAALVAALFATACSAPTLTPAPVPYPPTSIEAGVRGRLLLERGVQMLGGGASTLWLAGYELAGENRALRGNWLQARQWTDTTPGKVPTLVNYLVDLDGGRVLHEFLSTSPGPIQFNYRSRYDSAGMWQVDLMRWRTGDDLGRAPAAAGAANLAAHERLLPHGALRQALTRGDSIRVLQQRPATGTDRAVDVVSYLERRTRDRVEISLDVETGLPVSVTSGTTKWEYDEYRTIGSTRVPYIRRQLVNGVAFQEYRITRVDLKPSLADSRFEPPAGFVVAPPAGTPKATKVSGSVFRFDNMPGGYHAAFVVRAQDVVVLEAPADQSYSQTALRLIGEVAPGLPVTHVFVTHHHGDHVGGLGPYVARGARLVVGAGLEEAIRRQLPDSLRARVVFDPVSATRSFGSGQGVIQAHPVVNGHAEGALAFYLPAQRVLMQGDLFYIPERGAVPPAFSVTNAVDEVVRAAGLRVDHVVGVHGRTGTWAEVQESLRKQPARGNP